MDLFVLPYRALGKGNIMDEGRSIAQLTAGPLTTISEGGNDFSRATHSEPPPEDPTVPKRVDVRPQGGQKILELLPRREPLSAFALERLANFNQKDERIRIETFDQDERVSLFDLSQTTVIEVPAGLETAQISAYLHSKGKKPGSPLHLLTLAIRDPGFQQHTPTVSVLYGWKIGKLPQTPQEIAKKAPAKQLFERIEPSFQQGSEPSFFPRIGGTPTFRSFDAHPITTFWTPGVKIIVCDL